MFKEDLYEINNEIDKINQRIDSLCNAVNTNIASLQTIIDVMQDNDYVDSITPIVEGGETVGYEIVFTQSGSVKIYHGKKGETGHTPIVGVQQAEDGRWYWTIDGEWLLDGEGDKVLAEAIDGIDGEKGEEGITPKLEVRDNYWYISYDNGATWVQLGKATGENGKDGDSMFKSISYNEDYVELVLADGKTVIKIPTWASHMLLVDEIAKINSNISAIQAAIEALESNDYVQKVTPVKDEEGNVIGYTLQFAFTGDVTIFHGEDGKDGEDGEDGKDGEDGEDGKDGYTPVIGARQHPDGIWYWTVDGEWLLDTNGNRVKTTGDKGADGTIGITPELKIEDDYWYVSYDKGQTWTKLGKAKGEDGAAGSAGTAGDAFFKGVNVTEDYVTFTLADGTEIKIPTWKVYQELADAVAHLNTNVQSMQTIIAAIQNNDFVTGTTEIVDPQTNEVIGYTLHFSKSGDIEIYHGKTPNAPEIGIKKHPQYGLCWTYNGEYIKDPGTGAPVALPKDGASGVTPQFKIVDGFWFVSMDEGRTWQEAGQATGDQGETGATGGAGDSFFKSVKEEKVKDANGNDVVAYIVMTLADGSEYRVPTAYITDELTKRIAAIEGQFTVISTIVNALQNAEYIKEVVELYDGPTLVGYEITFVKYTIGTDGKLTETTRKSTIRNGGAGAAGTVVAAQYDEATDTWYWTLDGQPLKDKDGNYVAINGRPGQAGVTPKMQINKDTNEWEVSYDNGTTWTSTGVKATGPQGPQGNPGQGGAAGDSFFAGVSKDGDYWVFELVSGEKIMVPTAEAFASLAGRVAALEKSAESILSLVNGKKYIESCEPFSNDSGSGYHLVLVSLNAETGEATKEDCYIYNGIAGNTPVVGLRQDEATGDWYWTVDGEDLLVDGKPVKANGPQGIDGPVPSFRIDPENGHLYVTVNGEEEDLGRVVGTNGSAGEAGTDSSISVNTAEDGKVTITFIGGDGKTSTIEVPSWAVFVTVRDAVLNLNETVEALSDFVEGKSYITNIEECTKTDENGVTKTGFRISYVIYTDGQASEVQTKEIYNGIDGTNGHTPEMGLRQDEATGDWYWTVDGEDLLVNGKPVKANGADGVNAPVPSFEINVLGELVVTIGDETINLGKVVGTNGTAGTNSSIKVTEGEDGMIKIEFIVGENTTNTIYVPSWDEFVKVRDAVADLNETVEALSDFVEGKSYITNIEECTKTDENGVTKTGFRISYVVYTDGKASEEQTKEIYNGVDGTNGHTPEMGLRQDEATGDWFWTVDGEYLLVDGKPVKANGADGKNAPVPSFEINDNGELVVTIGEEDINLGKVVGTNGTHGTNSSIVVTEEEVEGVKTGKITIQFVTGEETTATIVVPSWDEFVKVRDAVADLNETVEALSDFVEGKSYITNIEECTKTDENGVTKTGFKISYVVYTDGKASEEQTKEIYNGVDGTNGHTPEMGLRPGSPDNNESADDWYWTVDGKDLLINNKPVKANGADGKDAPVPSFDINDDGELVVTIGEEDINLGKVVGTDGTNSSIVVTEEEVDGVKTGKIIIQFVTGEETTATIVVPSWDEFVKVRTLVDDLNQRVEDLEILLGDKTFITEIDPSWKETIDNVERTGTKITYVEIINGTPSEPKFMYIYNGLAGANGADGVTVGVKTWTAEDGEEGEVGKLYWTITQNNQTDWLRNGENLVPATGPQGKDGYSPKFKIVEGTLYYSYDKDNVSDEETEGWTVIGKVTGENGTDAVVEIDDKNANYYVIKYTIGDSVEEITVPKWIDASEVSVTFNPSTLNLGTDDEGTVTCTIEGSFTSAPEITVSCEGLYVSEIQGTPTTNADGAYQYTIKVTKTVSYAGATMSGKLTVMVPYYGTSIVKQLPITATSPSLEVQNINADKTSLTYSVGNISDDKKKISLIFEPKVDWITGTTFDEANQTTVVNLLANTTTQDRSCTITALLPDGRILDKRTINQLAYNSDENTNVGNGITNLADIESANCYIISAGGTYMFPTVKGNSNTALTTIHGLPKVIWSDNANNFEFVSATSDYIVFRVGSKSTVGEWLNTVANGNTLIGVKDKEGNILWSWHIWFSTTKPGDHTYPHAIQGEGTAGDTVMDRTLGSSGSTSNDGMYYQWGRKDPLKVEGNAVTSKGSDGTYEKSIQNPVVFYTNWNSVEEKGWTSKDQDKSINDPCPPGYRIPSNDVWMSDAPNRANSTKNYFTYSTTYAATTSEIYYPYSSYIDNNGSKGTFPDKVTLRDHVNSGEHEIAGMKVILNHSMYYYTYYGALWGSSDKPIYYIAYPKDLTIHSGKFWRKKYVIFGDYGWYDMGSTELSLVNTDLGKSLLLNEVETQYDIPEPRLINGYEDESMSPANALQVRCVKEVKE